ncbi:MAG TPA: hypothetical protein VIP11_07840 [Gemmatimonadaceae bacterium]
MSKRSKRVALAFASCVGTAVACHSSQSSTTTMTPPPAIPPQPQLSRPFVRTTVETQPRLAPLDTATEERVTLDTHGREVDVREVLTFLGQRAGLRFVFDPEIDKRVRVTLVDVPLSQAIQTVLLTARLTLEGGLPGQQPTTSVVFYELPANVDSLSTSAIMRRFGVSREIAAMIVDARPKKP